MKRSALLLPAVALALSLTAAGCGGSDSDSSDGGDAPASISKADFTEQANTICSDASDELQTAGAELTDQSTQEEVVAFVTDTAVPSFQAQHDDIEALGAPDGEEDDVQALLDALQDGIDAIDADPEAFVAGGATPFDDANAAADDLGLTDCGSES
jgi:ABC-type glycerol-3-phosphate transport system substrate-binding protein